MPGFKRKRTTTTTTTTMPRRVRARRAARRYGKRIFRNPTNTQVTVKRTLFQGAWQFGTATTVDFWRYLEFSVNSGFNNYTEFTNVFDRYRVNGMRVDFYPRFDHLAGPVTGATPMTVAKPHMVIVKDPYSNISPSGAYTAANLNTLLENGGKVYDATRPIRVYWKPVIPFTVSGGVAFKRAPFLRTSETGILHRGFHAFAYQNNFSTAVTDLIWDVHVTMYVTFKDLR